MFTTARPLPLVCLIGCLVLTPWSRVLAAEAHGSAPVPGIAQGVVPPPLVIGALPALEVQRRQTVAQTNRPNVLIGIAAGAAIVAGVGLITYGTSSTCKGRHGVNSCGKRTMLGGMAVSGGTVTLVVWGLSRP